MSVGIAIDQVSYQYSNEVEQALKSVRLSVLPGDIFGLLGPNGAG